MNTLNQDVLLNILTLTCQQLHYRLCVIVRVCQRFRKLIYKQYEYLIKDESKLDLLICQQLVADHKPKKNRRHKNFNLINWFLQKQFINLPSLMEAGCQIGNESILDWCVRPRASEATIRPNHLINLACKGGHFGVIKWLHKRYYHHLSKSCADYDIWYSCLDSMDILMWLRSRGYVFTEKAVHDAIKCGHVKVFLGTFHTNLAKLIFYQKSSFLKQCYILAAQSSNIQLLDYIYRADDDRIIVTCTYEIYTEAINQNSLILLNWLNNNGFRPNFFSIFSACSVPDINVDVFKCLINQNPYFDDPNIYNRLIPTGKVELLSWLYDTKHIPTNKNDESCHKCIIHARFGLLEWFLRHDWRVCLNTIRALGTNIRSETFQKYYKLMSRTSLNTFEKTRLILSYNNLELVKWLIENGFILSKDSCQLAIEHDNLDILSYLGENGYKLWNFNEDDLACITGPTIIEWIYNNSTNFDLDQIIFTHACRLECVSIVKQLIDRGHIDECDFNVLVRIGNAEILKICLINAQKLNFGDASLSFKQLLQE